MDAPEGWEALKVEAGTFYLNKTTGDYYFELDNSASVVDQLNAGEKLAPKFIFSVQDQHGRVHQPDHHGKHHRHQ